MNENLKDKIVSAISLGCDKNRVDLEFMLGTIKEHGFAVDANIENAHIILVNTCAFITPAVNETIENILLAISQKKYKCEKIIVTGCINERYKEEMQQNFADVDAFINVKDNEKIVETIYSLYGEKVEDKVKVGNRLRTTQKHFAFLKIADGCSNGCAYCTIPRIRGRYKSVEMKEVIKQAKALAEDGVKELVLVAQDTARYGQDLYGEFKIVELLKELVKIKEFKWIRMHYLYPELLTEEILKFINENEKMCKYLDIPLQHIDDHILLGMNRHLGETKTRDLILNIKQNYPNIAVRTTFILGFPGEKKKHFQKVLQFLEEAKLNNVGFFPYSREEKTKAYYMKGQNFEFVKKRRVKIAQAVQTKIANELGKAKIGNICEVVIDNFDEENKKFIGRDEFNSFEVDFIFAIDYNENIHIGDFVNVKITDYENGVFKGEIVWTYQTN